MRVIDRDTETKIPELEPYREFARTVPLTPTGKLDDETQLTAEFVNQDGQNGRHQIRIACWEPVKVVEVKDEATGTIIRHRLILQARLTEKLPWYKVGFPPHPQAYLSMDTGPQMFLSFDLTPAAAKAAA